MSRDPEILAPAIRALRENLPPEQVAALVVERARRALEARAVGLWRIARDEGALTLVAQQGFGAAARGALEKVPLDAPGLIARVARTGGPVEVLDAREAGPDRAFPRDLAAREGWSGVYGLPIVARGATIGALVAMTGDRRLTPARRGLAQALGDLWATAADRAMDVEIATTELRQVNEALRKVNERLLITTVRNQELVEQAEQAREQARLLLHLREEFMAAAAHELRTPITVVKGRAQLLLRRKDLLDARARESLEAIIDYADRIARLVDDMLTLARVRAPAALNRERVDLIDLARAEIARAAQTARAHRFRSDLAESLPVEGDRALLGEVFRHLLEHAARAVPEGLEILVRARREADLAVVSVALPGAEIAPERQPYIFEPLYEPVPSGEPGYLGIVSLGLYLSQQIIEAHGGRIWFTSTPGKGSAFRFSLPLNLSQRGDG